MKKLTCMLLALIMLFLIAACTRTPSAEMEITTTQSETTATQIEVSLAHENFIYYLLLNYTIARAPAENPNEMEILITIAQLKEIPYFVQWSSDSLYLLRLEVYENFLIFHDSGVSIIAYNLETGELFRLLHDFNTMAIWNGMVYYVACAQRPFSLYRKPLQPDAQPELLLGRGSAWHDEDYSSFFTCGLTVSVEGDQLFFRQQYNAHEERLWEFHEDGNHKLIES